MTAEDYRQGNCVMHRYANKSETWRQKHIIHVEWLNEMTQTIESIAKVVKWHENGQTDASGRPLTDEDCFTQIRAEVQAHGFLNSSDDEMSDGEEEEDDAMEQVQCVLCHIMIGEHVLMASEGRWAGLAHDDRIVCDQCYAPLSR